MQRRFLVILVCASLLGLLASALVYRVVSHIASAGGSQYEQIVVAVANMSLAETVTSQHVKLVPWPKASVPEGAVRNLRDAEGRVVRGSILAGEPLMEAKLAPELSGKGGIMPMLVPEGQRGVLLPSSRVDVLVSMPKAPGSQEKIAKVILQDVTVLAAGQTVELKDNKPVTNTTVTLGLTPQQTERLAVAQAEGKLMLVQRNLRDTQVVHTPGATPSSLLSDSGAVAPPADQKPKATLAARSTPLPLPSVERYPVAVIRGSKVSEQLFVRQGPEAWAEQQEARK
jgi:pilus assembly protein CpaB